MDIFVVTSNLIEKNGKFLLVQEGHKFAYGLWNFPAGRMEESISLVKNAVKEAKEETGYGVRVKGFVGVYHNISKGYHKSDKIRHVIIFVFASKIVGGKLRQDYPDSELLQAKWFSLSELKKMKKQLRGNYILQSIKDYKRRGVLDLKIINSKINP